MITQQQSGSANWFSNLMIRCCLALLVAIMLTSALFWLMQWMVMDNDNGLQQTSNLQHVDFIRLQKDTELNKKQRILKPEPEPEPPPPQPELSQPPPDQPRQSPPDMDMPNIDMPKASHRLSANLTQGVTVQPQTGQAGLGQPTSGLIPIVTSKPRYPLRAQSRNIEGWVTIEFTITPTGTVINPRVTASKPKGIFDRAALNAITKWKFKPKVENGHAVAQLAIQRMEFNLDRRRR
ncbi:MAG: TonB family protein [Gammaproteobacteria bacterium]|nr:TonB family protein [Gammaproteobacteria bacterium]